MADDTSKRVLERADRFFPSVAREQPRNLQCGRGSTLCCYGLSRSGRPTWRFIAEGLSRLHLSR
jgi:hypothetical protein